MQREFKTISASEWERRHKEFDTAMTECASGVRVPPEFQTIQKYCMPTHKEACNFQKITIPEIYHNSHGVAEREGWERLGCGVGRCAYVFKPNCVVKFARGGKDARGNIIGAEPWGGGHGTTGEESNEYEVAAYTVADTPIKRFLNPTIAHSPSTGYKKGYKWVVMPRVKTRKDIDYTKINAIENQVMRGLREIDAQCADIHEDNVGLLLNKYPVLIDYGFSVKCKRLMQTKPIQQGGLTKFQPEKTKHRGRHGLKRARGIPVGALTQRRRILWAEAGALRRKAKQYTDPDIRERMIADARFLEQQAWAFQTKLGGGQQIKEKEFEQMMGLLNQTRKEAFIGAEQ